MTIWHRLWVAISITALVGCGSPSPEGPVTSPNTGSAAAVVSPPVADAPRVALAAPHTPPPDTRHTDSSRATNPARDTRVPPAAAPADPPPSDAQTTADQVPYEARQQWVAALRESSDATVRLQALALWAAQPDDDIEPLFEALGDDDEAVQARAEELWEQQLAQEEAAGEEAHE